MADKSEAGRRGELGHVPRSHPRQGGEKAHLDDAHQGPRCQAHARRSAVSRGERQERRQGRPQAQGAQAEGLTPAPAPCRVVHRAGGILPRRAVGENQRCRSSSPGPLQPRGAQGHASQAGGPVGEAAAKLIEAAGGKMLAYYVTFGEYDWLDRQRDAEREARRRLRAQSRGERRRHRVPRPWRR